ncbi:hypothetical protein GGS20DRAFT_327086 [Poronia punctata]|nr:hypothetical protein GGS20DRAFT_327086 [Poronia punctata]
MANKRAPSPTLVQNPFIKKRNLQWSIDITGSSHDASSSSSSSSSSSDENEGEKEDEGKDHITHFSNLLSKTTISPFPQNTPRLSIRDYRNLYGTNADKPAGAHFIVHQHDHPVAGTHYDLRLQINETSSVSWAIMYGLPGDPNSFKLNRNATETRIHCLWNHLVETASHSTGSLIIWDTGTYTILPPPPPLPRKEDSQGEEEEENSPLTEQEKLHRAFTNRKIRLRLHGSRLPSPYVLNLRLTRQEDAAGRARVPSKRRQRRRRRGGQGAPRVRDLETDDEEEEEEEDIVRAPAETETGRETETLSAMERELRELEDEKVRQTNAYPGATNSIGSVYQRRWYLSLDREMCGFVKRRREGRVVWERTGSSNNPQEPGERLDYPFYVRGVEFERSVVTGRLGSEVLRDEGVVGYIRRKGWQAITK